jgi:hypothetical protein
MNAMTPAATMHSLFGGRSRNGQAPIPTIRHDVVGLTTEDLTSIVISTNALSSSAYFRLLGRGLRASSPTFSPFSEINSMPASSNASRILFTASSETCRRSFSKSTTVDRPNAALSARCDWVMSNNARAARHCAGVIIPTIYVDHVDGGTYKQFLLINRTCTRNPAGVNYGFVKH